MSYPWQLVLMLCYALGLSYRHVFKSQKCFDKKNVSEVFRVFLFPLSHLSISTPSPQKIYIFPKLPPPHSSQSLFLSVSPFLIFSKISPTLPLLTQPMATDGRDSMWLPSRCYRVFFIPQNLTETLNFTCIHTLQKSSFRKM